MIIDFKPANGGGGGGGGDMSNYYTKAQVNALVEDFITATTDDLVNYYLKSETYAKGEVDSLIGAVSGFSYEIAPSTASVVDPQSNVLYLIGPDQTVSGDQYEEYVYSNNAWVKIGDTSIDLAGYVTTSDLNTALANYVTSTSLANTLAGYASLETISTVAISGSYNDLEDKLVAGEGIVIGAGNVISATGATTTLATVATTGDYDDLINKPVIPVVPELSTVATTGSYNDLTDKPTIPVVPELSTVATTGSYNDLTDKPVIPVVPELSTVATTGDYNDLTNKPSIPDAVSGTNDGTNWTSLTIGTTTKAIPGGGDMSDYYTKSQTDALVANFITATTDDLVNYYLKSETYTQSEVNNLIGAVSGFSYEIAQSTSAVVDPQSNVLYLIGPSGSGSDQYEEYVYTNNTWTKIGDTSIDLSNYVTVNQLNTALGFYTTTQQLNLLLQNKQDVLTAGTGITISSNVISADSNVVSLTQAQYDALPVKDPDVIYIITDAAAITLSTVATSGSYNDLTDKPAIPVVPTLATVATSGSYNDLTDTPSIPDTVSGVNDGTNWTSITIGTTTKAIPAGGGVAQQQVDWAEDDTTNVTYIKNKPSLSTVATSGSYNDLTDKPVIPVVPTLATVATTGAYADLTGTPALATVATSGSYNDLTDKPVIPSIGTVNEKWDISNLSQAEYYDFYTNYATYMATKDLYWGTYPITAVHDYVYSVQDTPVTFRALTYNLEASFSSTGNPLVVTDMQLIAPDGTVWNQTGSSVELLSKIRIEGELATKQDVLTAGTGITINSNVISADIPTLATVATSGSYNDLTDKPTIPVVPTLATVATTGSYNDLTDKPVIPVVPTLSTVATTGDYDDLTNKPVIPVIPTLSTVATSGSYNDLTDKPVIPVVPTLATVATSGDYDDLTNKPAITDVSGVNDGTNWTSITIGTETAAIPAGGSVQKIELLELGVEDLLQFYSDAMDGTIKDFTNYTANGMPVINAYPMNSGFTFEISEGQYYTTDGTELALVMYITTPVIGTLGDTTQSFECYLSLFSPTLYQMLGGSFDYSIQITENVQGDWTEIDSVSPSYIHHKPVLSTVATSGSYNDLTDKPVIPVVPTLATVATTGAYNDLTGTPTLATVATSGSYNDLTDTPAIPTVGSGVVTLTQGGATIGTINVNDTDDKTIDIPQGGGGLGDTTVPITFSFNDGTTATFNVVIDTNNNNN